MNPQIGFLLNKTLESLRVSSLDSAELYLKQAMRLQSNNPHVYRLLGVLFTKQKKYQEALDCLNKSIAFLPKNSLALCNLGNVFLELKDYEKAIDAYDKSIKIDPNFEEVWSNKGNILFELKQYEDALIHYDKAISLKPNYADAWSNKGNTLHQLRLFEDSIAHYDRALSLNPDNPEAAWNKSLSLLLQGDYQNGWPLYESRWRSEKVSEIVGRRSFEGPTWLGAESLEGKDILLYGEQGLGDFVQFSRYVKLVADLGAKVILEAPETLAGLMQGLDGISQLVIKDGELPFFDYQCPLLSLPLAFKTNLDNIPNNSGYINLNNHPNKIIEWKARLGSKLKPRVGLVWSGNPHHKNDHNRSLLLRDILPFLPNQFEYISLQKEVREVDRLTLDSNPHILSFASHLNDFLDTAALLDNLDLVISVDTSVPHLSAAMGKETWILLPYVPDWRWLLDRQDSPWYPSVKLYRQSAINDWNDVLERVRVDLASNLS